MKNLTIIIFAIFILGCIKPNSQNHDSRIVWESEFIDTEIAGNLIFPNILSENVVVFRDDFFSKESALVCFDKSTGEKKWEWSDKYINSKGIELTTQLKDLKHFQEILIGYDVNSIYGINSKNGTTLWENKFENNILELSFLFEERLYYSTGDYEKNTIEIFSVNPLTGLYENILKVNSVAEDFKIGKMGVRIYRNNKNERCLLLGSYHIKNQYMNDEERKRAEELGRIGLGSMTDEQHKEFMTLVLKDFAITMADPNRTLLKEEKAKRKIEWEKILAEKAAREAKKTESAS